VGGRAVELQPGDSLLIQRGDVHGVYSRNGCILQEVSTTHVAGDSYYEDPRVGDLDPMQRKTILESW